MNKMQQNLNLSEIKEIREINEKIKNEQDPEELLKLRMQRMMSGINLNSFQNRPYNGYYPY